MKLKSTSSTDSNEKRAIYSKSNCKKVMTDNDTNETF